MLVSDREQYVDLNVNGSVSTSVTSGSYLPTLIAMYNATPQATTPVNINGAIQWISAITITHIVEQWKFIGSQETALVAADLYNTERAVSWYTEDDTTATTTQPLIGTDSQLNLQDVREVYHDITVPLISRAIEGTDNVPDMKVRRINIPVNRRFDFFTAVAAGTSGWQTKKGDLRYSVISDSSVVPSPTYFLTARVYFRSRYKR